MFVLQGVDHFALIVRDVSRSAAWYQEVLGLKPCHDGISGNAPARLSIGQVHLVLFPCRAAEPKPVPGCDTLTAHHVAFRADGANFSSAQAILKRLCIPFELQDHTSGRSLYLRDPDGHQIEITTYEED